MDNATKTEDVLYSDMAYDDAFRTMESECDDLLIPYVNYMFGEHYDSSAVITRMRNEHFIEHEDHSNEKRITDSHFTISQNGITKRYHLECESSKYDNSILIRLFEYGSQIAVDTAETGEMTVRLTFPNTGLLLLRGPRSVRDKAVMVIDTPDGSVSSTIPIMKIYDFTIKDIFDQKLYMLIPFYIFNYESDLEAINSDEQRIEKLQDVYRDILNEIKDLHDGGILSAFSCGVIINSTRRVIYKLMNKHERVQEKVGEIMGGKVLDLPEIRIFHEGKEQGRLEGRAEGEEERKQLEIENDSLRKELEQLKKQIPV